MTNIFQNIDDLKDNNKKIFSCLLSSLILADDGIEVTEDKITSLLKASGSDAEPIFASIVADSLKNKDAKEIAMQGGAVAGPAQAAGEKPQEEEKKEEEEEEEEEEAGAGMEGLGDLFGDDSEEDSDE